MGGRGRGGGYGLEQARNCDVVRGRHSIPDDYYTTDYVLLRITPNVRQTTTSTATIPTATIIIPPLTVTPGLFSRGLFHATPATIDASHYKKYYTTARPYRYFH